MRLSQSPQYGTCSTTRKRGQSAAARENLQVALEKQRAFAGADEARAALASLSGKS